MLVVVAAMLVVTPLRVKLELFSTMVSALPVPLITRAANSCRHSTCSMIARTADATGRREERCRKDLAACEAFRLNMCILQNR